MLSAWRSQRMELRIQFLTARFHGALERLSMIYPVDRRADAPLHHRAWQLAPVPASVKCHRTCVCREILAVIFPPLGVDAWCLATRAVRDASIGET